MGLRHRGTGIIYTPTHIYNKYIGISSPNHTNAHTLWNQNNEKSHSHHSILLDELSEMNSIDCSKYYKFS